MLKNIIQKASDVLKNKGIVIFPTDTVYGIGAIPNKNSIDKIYKIKKRDYSKKIIALVSTKEKVLDLIDKRKITKNDLQKIEKITDKFWPGELTIIFQSNKEFTDLFDKELDTIGIRMPKNKIALEIIDKSGGVVLTTSANLSGGQAVTKLENINDELIKNVDYIVKSNEHLTGTPSTIVKYNEGDFTLLRQGNVKLEEIRNYILEEKWQK